MSPETKPTERSYVGVKTSRVIPPAAGSSLYVASSAIASWSANAVMARAGDRPSASRDSAHVPHNAHDPGLQAGVVGVFERRRRCCSQLVGRRERFLRHLCGAGALALHG